MMNNQLVIAKANSLRGCLAGLKTVHSHRRHPVDEDALQFPDEFARDEARLVASKSYRRLADKTQVFTFPESPLVRSRLTHVMEVVGCSVVASEMMGLNTSLVRAAAIGHDIGHVPFGHQGENWMAKEMGMPYFCHETLGSVIAQHIERRGKGLNLTWHVLDAMYRHSGNNARPQMSAEAWLLRYCDKFAYIFHDLNDISDRMGYPLKIELQSLADKFGSTQRERTFAVIAGMIVESAELGVVSFEHSEMAHDFIKLRDLMYEIYPCVTQQNVGEILGPVVGFLRRLQVADPWWLLAMMTDHDIRMVADEYMKDVRVFKRTSVAELLPWFGVHSSRIGMGDPDLDW